MLPIRTTARAHLSGRRFGVPKLAPRARIAAPVLACLSQNRRSFGLDGRGFHSGRPVQAVKPYLLADIGEGITECQIIQWFIQPGARVQQFDKICEVQSDKASVEITSRFDGVITKLHYDTDDMAKVGKPLVDIDVEGEEEEIAPSGASTLESATTAATDGVVSSTPSAAVAGSHQAGAAAGRSGSLATPAVRHLVKELKVEITDIQGSGKDGRVLKEDVLSFVAARDAGVATGQASGLSTPAQAQAQTQTRSAIVGDTVVTLTPIQKQMFKTMTKSLSIPHFLYTDAVDFSSLDRFRRRLSSAAAAVGTPNSNNGTGKVTPLPFIIKAVSLSLRSYPTLNAHLDAGDAGVERAATPVLTVKGSHNIGVAVDTPAGLIVPVVKDVQDRSIESIAAEVGRLSSLAREGKLTSADLTGATITVSNIGSIGGTTVAPVIVGPQVAILGVGRARTVPAFGEDGMVVPKMECVFSWSADHRVVDGAMMARFAGEVRSYLENVERMVMVMR